MSSRLNTLAATPISIQDLFASEPDRLSRFVLREGALRADFSKQAVSQAVLDALIDHARDRDLIGWREKLFAGAPINSSEGRPVLHMALRGVGGRESVRSEVSAMKARMADFVDHIHREGKFKTLIHIGIGGSDLGPRLVADGLSAGGIEGGQGAKMDLRFVENIDGASMNDALVGANPSETLVIIVSKSFGTQETLMNALAAREWLARTLGDKAGKHCIAVTANRERAIDFGITADHIFDFWDWVGGRYSVWSAVGLSLRLCFGTSAFDDFLDGAQAMDVHFRDRDLHENMPVLMALMGIWNRNYLGYGSQAIIPYSRRLRKFSAFLQQLEMESNGKSVMRDGQEAGLTCPVIWGDEGTNGQHAFFQWLHQGSPGAPVDFIALLTDHEGRPDHHKALLANCFAQSEALMVGKSDAVVREELRRAHVDADKIDQLAPQKTFSGNRPSTTLTLDALSPFALGQLIALYEHKVFVQGVLWGVNSFDQWGVELGKVLAGKILSELGEGRERDDMGAHDPSTQALIALFNKAD